MSPVISWGKIIASLCFCFAFISAAGQSSGSVHLRLHWSAEAKSHPVPAVMWLEPQSGTIAPEFAPLGHYTLLQKNREFIPHLQVVPVGSVVSFPNADPFFHNVFSLFDGKRFDLGLYEAGSSKSVTFSREGVSYIFCNIHPEMSAVVITLSTPLFAVASRGETFSLPNVPPGSYRLHLWIEGMPLDYLDSLTRTVQIESGNNDLGTEAISSAKPGRQEHANKFGRPYAPASQSPY